MFIYDIGIQQLKHNVSIGAVFADIEDRTHRGDGALLYSVFFVLVFA